jgi:ribonuclease-3
LTSELKARDRRTAAVSALEAALGYTFTDRALLERALTHASVSGVSPDILHNETLEFLGDRVLGLLAAEHLLSQHPREREGALSHRLHAVVSREACARVGRAVGVQDAMRKKSVSVERTGRAGDTVVADATEALLAAIYLDGGLDAARAVFARVWEPELEASAPVNPNPKVELQELMQKHGRPAPTYEIVATRGPAHAPELTVSLHAEGEEPVTASGRSRHEAEKAAARILLERQRNP